MRTRDNKINILLSCMVALMVSFVGACDDTIDGGQITGFPTDTLFVDDAQPGDTIPVSFSVGYSWKVNSDKDWCRVNGEAMSMGGKAGTHTVNFVVGHVGDLFEDQEAFITLNMNNESRVIAHIIRRASMEYDMEVSHNGKVVNSGESIAIGDSGRVTLGLAPNFNMDMLSINAPKWIKLEREKKNLILNVVEDSLKYTINREDDSLRLFKDSTFYCSLHVQYAGMNPHKIHIDGQLNSLVVLQDASCVYVDDEKQEMPVEFTVTALNDRYGLVPVGYNRTGGCYMLGAEDVWFTVEDDGYGNVSLSVTEENGDEERSVHLMALPQALLDSLDSDEAMLEYLCEDLEGILELKETALDFRLVKIQQDGLNFIKLDPATRWNLKVTMNGQQYFDAIMGDTCNAPMKVSIGSARGYELMCAEYGGQYTLMPVEESWLNVEDDKKGNVKIGFDANGGNERTLLLFALPLPLIQSLEPDSEEFQEKLLSTLFAADSLLEEQYVVAKIVQEANPENSMKVLRGGLDVIEVAAEVDPEWLTIAGAKGVAADKVFRCSMKMGYVYQVKPLIHMSIWNQEVSKDTNGENKVERRDKIEIYGKSGKKYEPGIDYNEEFMLMEEIEGEYYLVELSKMRGKITEDFIIYFINDGVEYMKALVVTLL